MMCPEPEGQADIYIPSPPPQPLSYIMQTILGPWGICILMSLDLGKRLLYALQHRKIMFP